MTEIMRIRQNIIEFYKICHNLNVMNVMNEILLEAQV